MGGCHTSALRPERGRGRRVAEHKARHHPRALRPPGPVLFLLSHRRLHRLGSAASRAVALDELVGAKPTLPPSSAAAGITTVRFWRQASTNSCARGVPRETSCRSFLSQEQQQPAGLHGQDLKLWRAPPSCARRRHLRLPPPHPTHAPRSPQAPPPSPTLLGRLRHPSPVPNRAAHHGCRTHLHHRAVPVPPRPPR